MISRAQLIRDDEYWIEIISNALWRNSKVITPDEGDQIGAKIFAELKPVLQEILTPTENDPIERLRNKLSPFMNLVSMLSHHESFNMPFEDEAFNEIFVKEFRVCQENLKDIDQHLLEAHTIVNSIQDGKEKSNS